MRRECGAVISFWWHEGRLSRDSVVHKLMDAMSSALKLRSAGLTPHFHAERSSNGSCGSPLPVRSWSGRWKNPRRRLMSQLHEVLQSVPLGRSVHGHVAVEPIANFRFPLSLSTFLHGVEASHLAGCRGSRLCFRFLSRFPRLSAFFGRFPFSGPD